MQFLVLKNPIFSKFYPRYVRDFTFSPSLNKFSGAPMISPVNIKHWMRKSWRYLAELRQRSVWRWNTTIANWPSNSRVSHLRSHCGSYRRQSKQCETTKQQMKMLCQWCDETRYTWIRKILLRIISKIYDQGTLPEDFKAVNFTSTPKKNSSQKCSEYRTIALMNHSMKLLLAIRNARIEKKICYQSEQDTVWICCKEGYQRCYCAAKNCCLKSPKCKQRHHCMFY